MSANNLDALLATRSSPSATQGGGPTTRQKVGLALGMRWWSQTQALASSISILRRATDRS